MAKDRITDQTIVADFSDGDVLYGADVNKIIKVFKEGINKNKIDLNRILTGSEYFFIADDLSGLTALISEQVPEDGQKGYVFDGQENQGNLEVYVYKELAGRWDFLHNRLSLDGGVNIQTSDTQPTNQIVGDFWYDTSGITGGVGNGYEPGGVGNSYEPDGVTIVLNEEDKLKVSENLGIDGGYL